MNTLPLLLQTSLKLFLLYGIKSVSMDDIARDMGMSKKTLYQYVSDKGDLVNKTVEYYIKLDCVACDEITNTSLNAIEQLASIAVHLTEKMGNMSTATIYDLQKYYPNGWKLIETHKKDYILLCISKNIKKGIDEQLFRSDLQVDIVAQFYISLIESTLQSAAFYSLASSYSKILPLVIEYHLHALMSDKGRAYFTQNKRTLINLNE